MHVCDCVCACVGEAEDSQSRLESRVESPGSSLCAITLFPTGAWTKQVVLQRKRKAKFGQCLAESFPLLAAAFAFADCLISF